LLQRRFFRWKSLRTRHFAVNARASADRRGKIETIAGRARGNDPHQGAGDQVCLMSAPIGAHRRRQRPDRN
jgi:hypothetical protein